MFREVILVEKYVTHHATDNIFHPFVTKRITCNIVYYQMGLCYKLCCQYIVASKSHMIIVQQCQLQTWVMLSPYKLYCHNNQHDNDQIDQLNVAILEFVYKCSIHLYNFVSNDKAKICTILKFYNTIPQQICYWNKKAITNNKIKTFHFYFLFFKTLYQSIQL